MAASRAAAQSLNAGDCARGGKRRRKDEVY